MIFFKGGTHAEVASQLNGIYKSELIKYMPGQSEFYNLSNSLIYVYCKPFVYTVPYAIFSETKK
jgi:hypothetical protein